MLLTLVLVRSFSYTFHASFDDEFYTPGVTFSEEVLIRPHAGLVRRFSYTPYANFSEKILLHPSCWFIEEFLLLSSCSFFVVASLMVQFTGRFN